MIPHSKTPAKQLLFAVKNFRAAFDSPVVGGSTVMLKKIEAAGELLDKAIARFEAQDALNQAMRSRLPDEELRKIMLEELQRVLHGTPVHQASADAMRTASFAAMRRIANYGDHLHDVLVRLSKTIDLPRLLYTLAEAERRAANSPRINWDSPSLKPLGEIVAEILSEVKTTERGQ